MGGIVYLWGGQCVLLSNLALQRLLAGLHEALVIIRRAACVPRVCFVVLVRRAILVLEERLERIRAWEAERSSVGGCVRAGCTAGAGPTRAQDR